MKCPACGTDNRPNAKFCARCRSPLPAVKAMTMKLCPQCGKQNRFNARFCAGCGHTFGASSLSAGVSGWLSQPRHLVYAAAAATLALGLVVTVGLLLVKAQVRQTGGEVTPPNTVPARPVGATPTVTLVAPTPTRASSTPVQVTATPLPAVPTSTSPRPTAVPPASDALNRALLATVQVIVPLEGQAHRYSTGSGSIVTAKGHVLTNFHVVGDPDSGQLYNRQGVIFIAVSPPGLKGPPQIEYTAELVQGDRSTDLALLKIVADQDGGALPADLGLTTMPIGDSDTVKIGDELSIIGFPGLGGETVTLTKGSVSGFLTDEGWIKTDAEINSGNSGGSAINRTGQLVGIPSAASTEAADLPGKIGLVRPINMAGSLIEQARREAGE